MSWALPLGYESVPSPVSRRRASLAVVPLPLPGLFLPPPSSRSAAARERSPLGSQAGGSATAAVPPGTSRWLP
ncbi:MAG: hypothetical protein ACKOFW_17470, partial [Planctomycetaceae bacterium]